MYKALIVDDESDICQLISLSFMSIDINCVEAYSVSDAICALQNETFDVCFTDLKLPDGDGFDIVKYIQENYPTLPVAMMTAHGNVESAIEALKLGAFDFISKPFEIDQLRKLALDAIKTHTSAIHHDSGDTSLHGIYGNSAATTHLKEQIKKLARSQAPVYIHGESGTGKELVARAIHNESARKNGPFIAVNCGAIPEHLVESEFFGHKKGSFTGADKDKIGLFQAAEGGTLMLDEVADLPLTMQVKLLRAIQERSIRPVGELKEIPVNVRIVSATHKDLAKLVEEHTFRQDLYYRLNVITLNTPPLRERLDDLPVLTEIIMSKINHQNETSIVLANSALEALRHYHFPGNVRELENILERASALCDNNEITDTDLLLISQEPSNQIEKSTVNSEMTQNSSDEIVVETQPIICDNDIVIPDEIDDIEAYLEAVERKILRRALDRNTNKTEAAKDLGISFRTFRYRLKKLNVESDGEE